MIYPQSHGDNNQRKHFYLETFSGSDVIVELGVADGFLSKTFMQCSKTVIGVDVKNTIDMDEMLAHANSHNSRYEFIHSDDLLIDPIECDVLFIDSSHEEEHTYQELKKFSSYVKKYIALHDIFPELFETLKGFDRWYEETGKDCWEEYHRDYSMCGLLVLKRKN